MGETEGKKLLYKLVPQYQEDSDILELLVESVVGRSYSKRGGSVLAWMTPEEADLVMLSFQEAGFEFSLATSLIFKSKGETESHDDGEEAS